MPIGIDLAMDYASLQGDISARVRVDMSRGRVLASGSPRGEGEGRGPRGGDWTE